MALHIKGNKRRIQKDIRNNGVFNNYTQPKLLTFFEYDRLL